MNNSGPSTDPWGTLQSRAKSAVVLPENIEYGYKDMTETRIMRNRGQHGDE